MEQEQTEKAEVAVITLKVPKQLKTQMKNVKINWSEYIRQCVQSKIDQQRRQEALDNLAEIRKHTKPVSNDELLSWIKEGRERNY